MLLWIAGSRVFLSLLLACGLFFPCSLDVVLEFLPLFHQFRGFSCSLLGASEVSSDSGFRYSQVLGYLLSGYSQHVLDLCYGLSLFVSVFLCVQGCWGDCAEGADFVEVVLGDFCLAVLAALVSSFEPGVLFCFLDSLCVVEQHGRGVPEVGIFRGPVGVS